MGLITIYLAIGLVIYAGGIASFIAGMTFDLDRTPLNFFVAAFGVWIMVGLLSVATLLVAGLFI